MRYFSAERKQYGTRRAVVRLIRREGLPLIGYLILATGTGFAISTEHTNASNARAALQQTTYNVLYEGCVSGNALRVTLQHILINPKAIKQAENYVRTGRITQQQLDEQIALAHEESATLAPRNCKNAYAQLKPK